MTTNLERLICLCYYELCVGACESRTLDPNLPARSREISVIGVSSFFGLGFELFIPLCAARETVKLVFYVLVCQVHKDTPFVLWQPVGDGVSFHTALQRRFLSLPAKITSVKLEPAENCMNRKGVKGVLFKGGKDERKYSRVL